MALWQPIKKYLSPTVKGRLSYTSIKQEWYNSMKERVINILGIAGYIRFLMQIFLYIL